MAVLYFCLLSIDYGALKLSNAVLSAPAQLAVLSLIDTTLFVYFVTSSGWARGREWGAVFAILFGTVYFLTAVESAYLGSLLPADTIPHLLLNGAITSGAYAAAIVWVFGSRKQPSEVPRLQMPRKEWAWKIAVSSVVYLALFIVFGLLVYAPLAKALDSTAYTQEQARAASTAVALVLPTEAVRGALWALLLLPAIRALPFGWRKTGVVAGILMAVPLTLVQFIATTMAAGLQVAHAGEIFGENLVYGVALLWVLNLHSRLRPVFHQGGSMPSELAT